MMRLRCVEGTTMALMSTYQDAVGQALADTRAVLAGGLSARDPIALGLRLGDLSRSSSLLSLEAHLKTLEHYSRRLRFGRRSARALARSRWRRWLRTF